ncbi:MAG: AraC family transcriptional regulator [Clostridia bacterium]|nr:AraC family transcriptional regulator [Clostridia bacterium]
MSGYLENYSQGWSEDSVRLIATPSQSAKNAFFYVQEVGYFKTQPQYFTERENLSSYLVVYTVSGKGFLTYKGKAYTLLPGQAFFIDCMEYQHYRTDSKELWEILWVHFNGSTSSGYYDQFAKSGLPLVSLSQDSALPMALQDLIELYRQKDIRTELLSSKLLSEMLTELLLAAGNIDTSNYMVPDYIRNAMRFLDRHFSERITLDQLADQFAVSKFYFAREFKKYTGFSPNEYLINTRITYAKELLKYSDVPIAGIAEKAGIENVSHFIHLFKSRTEHTPLNFRNKWKRSR